MLLQKAASGKLIYDIKTNLFISKFYTNSRISSNNLQNENLIRKSKNLDILELI